MPLETRLARIKFGAFRAVKCGIIDVNGSIRIHLWSGWQIELVNIPQVSNEINFTGHVLFTFCAIKARVIYINRSIRIRRYRFRHHMQFVPGMQVVDETASCVECLIAFGAIRVGIVDVDLGIWIHNH